MFSDPFRLASPTSVEPGQTVLTSTGALYVDEVSRDLTSVRFLGWPAHRAHSGRRSSLEVKTGDDAVQVAPDREQLPGLRAALLRMADLAGRYGQQVAMGEASKSCTPDFEAEGSTLIVRVKGFSWRLPLVELDEADEVPLVVDEEPF